jgi:hypothetical protein
MNTKKELRKKIANLEDRIKLSHILINTEIDVEKRFKYMELRWKLVEEALIVFNDLLTVYDQGEQ